MSFPSKVACSPKHNTILLLLIAICVLPCGCKGLSEEPSQETIWKTEARSPDGTSIATASRVRYSGPGNAGLYTFVYLKRTIYSNPEKEIITFDQNNILQAEAARLNLAMKWVTPSDLDVTYNGHAGTLDFQVAKYADINITVHQSPE